MNGMWDRYAAHKKAFFEFLKEHGKEEIGTLMKETLEKLPFVHEIDWVVTFSSFNDGDACIPYLGEICWRYEGQPEEEEGSRWERSIPTGIRDIDNYAKDYYPNLPMPLKDVVEVLQPLADFLSEHADALIRLWGDSHHGVVQRDSNGEIRFEVDTGYWED